MHERFGFRVDVSFVKIGITFNIGESIQRESMFGVEGMAVSSTNGVCSIICILEFDKDKARRRLD